MNKKESQRVSIIAKDLLLDDKRFEGQKSIDSSNKELLKSIYLKAGWNPKQDFIRMSISVLNRLKTESQRKDALFNLEWFREKRLRRRFILK